MRLGNGDSAGSAGVPLDEIDRQLAALDSTLTRLAIEREFISALSYAAGDDYTTGMTLARQDAQAAADQRDGAAHRDGLLTLREQGQWEAPGGGGMFGLGVVPVLIGVAAVLASIVAWITYVVNAMDGRRTERDRLRAQLVASGQAPPSILSQEEPGILASIGGVISKAGLWVVGGLLVYAWATRGRARG